MGAIIFVTGADTSAGKTVLTALLVHHTRSLKCRALAVKPFCSGGLGDARILAAAQDHELSLTQISPFQSPRPVAPLLDARMAGQRITCAEVLKSIQSVAGRCDVLFVEGAGGLLAPLGETFTALELISALRCSVIVTARNKLGTINHILLTLAALRQIPVSCCKIVLMNGSRTSLVTRTNPDLIREFGTTSEVFELPFLGSKPCAPSALPRNAKKVKRALASILGDGISFFG